MPSANPWVSDATAPTDPWIRLFCLPYAGGNASVYRSWSTTISPLVHVCPIELPGHGTRLHEPLPTSLGELVHEMRDGLAPLLDRPFAVLGHSMGAAVALHLALELERSSPRPPMRLFVMGLRPVHLPRNKPLLHQLQDDELIARLRSLGGTPDAVLEHDELMQFLLPILRADFRMMETSPLETNQPLACGLSALTGRDDAEAPLSDMESWRGYTQADFSLRAYPGDHFFPWSCPAEVIADIESDLQVGP